MEDIKGTISPTEGAQPTPTEGAPTPTEKEPTLDITKTREFQEALDRAVGKGLASTNQQLSQKQKALERMENSFRKLESAHERVLGEQSQEALDGYRRAKSQEAQEAEREMSEAKLAVEKFEIGEAKRLNQLALRAIELWQENPHVPFAELTTCESEREMGLVVKAHPKSPKDEVETPKKFDPGVSTASGADLNKMSPDDLIRRGLERAKIK